ncbi:sensor histidine kinase [Hymenobacter sp.]|jgi:signal transduction histidine kinase|uniref:sensor histidine kinase n=1 Tax=Hymenobacter sp. TaxID=1898978 RepID=UPI002ED8FFC0
MTTLEQLQTQLAEAANATPPDIDLIQAITNKITQLDTENVRFTIDAGIINRLGQELVGKQETAVAELIKNAYDADATDVKIIFSNTDAPGGTMLIEDNGLGMTRDQLLNGFMRLSSNDKLLHPTSERYQRRRAGRKGIGRFAVQRLGEELVLTTQTPNSEKALRVTVDWEIFRAGRDLGSIKSRVEEIAKERPYGTTLFIRKLREAWTNAEQRRVYRYVSELLQPFPLTKFKDTQTEASVTPSANAGRFDVELIQQTGAEKTVIASQEETIFSNALAIIEGHVDDKGQGKWSVESIKLGIAEETWSIGHDRENKKSFIHLRNVSIKAYYYIWNADLFPRILFGTLQEIGRQQGGIRVFRNGFRVPPYGERGDDWLQLDASYAGRKFLPPHANNNFIGLIELSDSEGELFEERSSREGLIENDAFRELQDFAYRLLTAAIQRIAEAREKKQTAGQTDWQKKPDSDPAQRLRVAATQIRETISKAREQKVNQAPPNDSSTDSGKENSEPQGDANEKGDEPDEFTPLDDAARDIEEAANDAQTLLQENQMLRVLASLGIMIGEFTHEIRQTLGSAQLNTEFLSKIVPTTSRERRTIDHLAANISLIRGYSSYFYQTVSDNVSRELEPQDLRVAGRQFEDAMSVSIKRAGITLTFEPQGYELLTPPMHSSEISSLLFNFYSNALKAIRRAKSTGHMLLRVGEENKRVFLEFADNGDGIPEHLKERIFNAFFTTDSPASRSSSAAEEAQGSGLGLKIVYDIVTVYGGEVFLTTPPNGYTTCIRAEFPAYQYNE